MTKKVAPKKTREVAYKTHCDCDMRTKLVGDGCEVCNPELAFIHAREEIKELKLVIRAVFSSLPTNKDWLDPDLEKAMRGAIE